MITWKYFIRNDKFIENKRAQDKNSCFIVQDKNQKKYEK